MFGLSVEYLLILLVAALFVIGPDRLPGTINLFGTYSVTSAFLPALTRSRGAVVNILSITAWAPIPVIPAYSISKAAAFSLRRPPESVAHAIFDGVEQGKDEIFPDPVSAAMAESWRSGAAKALERQYAALARPS
ncbi:SDR family NAD(P)-dependent oxidoreductase [Amycolatopsis sp. RTGN1]|uniref:SDR family NAD(P)-dependent oxidoreductase n=1 Tax=Amycolatopsis ponsaeliensis TaxID=2992142 RepID=UPI00254E6F77|nr:SDR family NAD(P)-dependent oxidoreductase [Amycolatopsis sp. RTGN1]